MGLGAGLILGAGYDVAQAVMVSHTGDRWNPSPQFYKNIRILAKQLDEAAFVFQKEEESDIISTKC